MRLITFPEFQKLCSTYSVEHAIAALDKNCILDFTMMNGDKEQLLALNKVLFAKRPDVQLSIYPVDMVKMGGKRYVYTQDDFEFLSRLDHVEKLRIVFNTKQDLATLPVFDSVKDLQLSIGVKMNLQLLSKFPNVDTLCLQGKFSEVSSLQHLQKLSNLSISGFEGIDFYPLKGIRLKTVHFNDCIIDDSLSSLLSENVEYISISEVGIAENIDFILAAIHLKKLFLDSFILTKFPDFVKLPDLKVLQINAMRRIEDLDPLINSNIEYLFVLVSADKISAKVFAETLMQMKHLKKALMRLMDRNEKRYTILKKYLEKEGRLNLLSEDMNFFEIA